MAPKSDKAKTPPPKQPPKPPGKLSSPIHISPTQPAGQASAPIATSNTTARSRDSKPKPSLENKDVPRYPSDWKKEMTTEGLPLSSTIHEKDIPMGSGSQMEWKQYLLLRPIWSEWTKTDKETVVQKGILGMVSKEYFAEAKTRLEKTAPFEQYIKSLEWNEDVLTSLQGGKINIDLIGIFAGVRFQQGLVNQCIKQSANTEATDFDAIGPLYDASSLSLLPPLTGAITSEAGPRSITLPVRGLLPSAPITTAIDLPPSSFTRGSASGSTPVPTTPPAQTYMGSTPSSSPMQFSHGSNHAHNDDTEAISQDEERANMALISFLQAISIRCAPLGSPLWIPDRRAFIAKYNTGGKMYEARVDGVLTRPQNDETVAIIEVKPVSRDTDTIRIQETGQMAAWICQNPPSKAGSDGLYRRVLVSQDHRDCYITVATFGVKYVNYIRNVTANNSPTNSGPPVAPVPAEPTNDEFLRMREYGPFNIYKPLHMQVFATLILGQLLHHFQKPTQV